MAFKSTKNEYSSWALGFSRGDELINFGCPWARHDDDHEQDTAVYPAIKFEDQQEIKVEPLDGNSLSDSLCPLSDEEEMELIAELGLDLFQSEELSDVKPEWLTAWQEDNLDLIKKNKIRRPGNGFIRFSIINRKAVAAKHAKRDNRFISRILGSMWRKLDYEEKSVYTMDFESEMRKIREDNPEWNYAASRAKVAVAQMTVEGIIPQRLRNRNKTINYNESQVAMQLVKREPVEKNMSKAGVLKQRRKKKAVSAGKTKLARKTVAPNSGVALDTLTWVMCDDCCKWRRLQLGFDASKLPQKWICSMNSDPAYAHCELKEESYPVDV